MIHATRVLAPVRDRQCFAARRESPGSPELAVDLGTAGGGLQVGSDGALLGCVTKWQSDRRGACFAAGLSGLFRASINSLYCPS